MVEIDILLTMRTIVVFLRVKIEIASSQSAF